LQDPKPESNNSCGIQLKDGVVHPLAIVKEVAILLGQKANVGYPITQVLKNKNPL
jgi:hypothetical protein